MVSDPVDGLTWPRDPALLPLAPMVYVAWADGILTPEQLNSLCARLEDVREFDASHRAEVHRWLDPVRPPTPHELQALLRLIKRQVHGMDSDRRLSLAELGLELIPAGSALADDSRQSMWQALTDVEAALGVLGTEASRELRAPSVDRRRKAPPLEPTPFDPVMLQRMLDGPHHEVRERVKRVLDGDEFAYRYGLSTSQYRDVVFRWTRVLADAGLGRLGLPREYGGEGDFGGFIAAFETLALHDLNLVVKFGVQFGLFAGSIQFLGSRSHHERFLKLVGDFELPGCFAMTELGHGSNVWDLETTATYDPVGQSFIVSTPRESARKEWIGNAAVHGRLATVFAQLDVQGERYGVHAFLVPIRDESGKTMPGVRIEDCGEKGGLNGVDNGRLWFDDVRIPRDHLLDRYGHVSAAGRYESSIGSPSRRFFTMLGTLMGGRVSVAGASVSASSVGLTIAVKYGAMRRQFGPAGEPERPILDYLAHQRRLMPRLATTYALIFAQQHLVDRFVRRSDDDMREIEAMAAGLKAYSSTHAVDTLQHCREACGGQGYLAINRIPSLRADADVFVTFEGDNTVLMQLVAKGLLTEYKHQFGDMKFWGIIKFLADRAATAVAELNPVITRKSDASHLRDPEFHLGALRYREARLLHSLARRLKSRIDDGMDSFDAINDCQDHAVSVAIAYMERTIYEAFDTGIRDVADADLRRVLELLRTLYALWRIESQAGWFLEAGYIESGKAKAVRATVNALCREIRGLAVPLVDAFGIPDSLLGAPIAESIDPRSTEP